MEDGQEWMAIKPNEIETMRQPIARAAGQVVAFGLGMGYYALWFLKTGSENADYCRKGRKCHRSVPGAYPSSIS